MKPEGFDYFYYFLHMELLKNTKKAFTLVELIVVITILAILASISYTSYQGYASEARNSKRQADIRTAISKISNRTASGMNVTNAVVNDANLEVASGAVTFWGDTAGTSYNNNVYTAWKINFTAIEMDEALDPLRNVWYNIWAVNRWWIRFEIAWVVETDNGEVSYVKWDYSARDASAKPLLASATTWGTTFTLNEDPNGWIGFFKKWDKILTSNNSWTATVWGTEYTIQSVSADLKTVTVTPVITATDASPTYIRLSVAEITGLTTPNGSSTIVTDGITTLPY